MKKMSIFLLLLLLLFLSNTFHSADSEEQLDGNFSILELLDISIVSKIKGMQENADIVWESDLW